MDLINQIKSKFKVSKSRAEAKRKAALANRSGNLTLKAETRAIIAQLKNVDWYSNIGRPLEAEEVHQVHSWARAIALDAETDWENTTLDAANEIGSSIQAVSWEKYRRWNEVVRALKLELEPVWQQVKAASQRQTITQSQCKQIIDCVQWDTLHWGIESEFSEFGPPGFFSQLGEWYLHGHFPCGWHGKYPSGRLIVF